ncbi:MAG: polysaccharide deacetylase family protein [Gammaproteobacteria bacterium]
MNWSLRIKYILAEVFFRLGILRWLMRTRLRGKTVVLMYHRVLPETAWEDSLSSDGIIVTPETFRQHLRWLKEELEVLDLGQFRIWLSGNKLLQRPGCLITFDDGWYDNYTHALPLLREANVPAVFFLATDYIGTTQTFWQEQLGQALWRLVQRTDNDARTFLTELQLNNLADQPSDMQKPLIIHAVRKLKELDWKEIEDILQRAINLSGIVGPGEDRFMDWDQVRALQTYGMTICSHGTDHRLLPSLDNTQLNENLKGSRKQLCKELGTEIDGLAYPNGDYDNRVVDTAVAAGYRIAFTTESGPTSQGDDPMRLRRINIFEHVTSSPAMLACRLSGIF